MKRFARLYNDIDSTNKTSEKVAAMVDYFRSAPPEDAAWAIAFLVGRRPKRLVTAPRLALWATERAGIPDWLFQESLDAVGDLAETIALVLPADVLHEEDLPLHRWVEDRLLPLASLMEELQKGAILDAWDRLDRRQCLVFNKLLLGAFRVGVSQDLVVRSVSQASGVPVNVVAHRLMGDWTPDSSFYSRLVGSETGDSDVSRPYPFCLAHPLEASPASLGPIESWHAEWKWDGIRAQVIRRDGQSFVWTRGEELVTERYPEIADVCDLLPDGTVLDGELLAWQGDRPMLFLELQKRIGRKTVSKKLMQEVPVALVAFDVLEFEGQDLRDRPLEARRAILERLVEETGSGSLMVSPRVSGSSWEELEQIRESSRERNVEGLMLKRLDSPYLVGRKKGLWWKWKVSPMTVDAVLIYAQPGNGKRASLFTDYTFGVWHEGKLVPFAKAYSGLNDEEIREVDGFVRRNTLERFGPVRVVKPELVMELAFEAIQLSTRHKSGVAVRFPRIARWRHDKKPEDADTLESIKELLKTDGETASK
ncbi:MAG TPA: ATP-dependent DNA ligase [Fimbriimonas sp.]